MNLYFKLRNYSNKTAEDQKEYFRHVLEYRIQVEQFGLEFIGFANHTSIDGSEERIMAVYEAPEAKLSDLRTIFYHQAIDDEFIVISAIPETEEPSIPISLFGLNELS